MLIIETSKLPIQQQALTTCLKLMASEGKFPFEETGKFSYYFPLNRLKSILRKLLSPDRDNTNLISRFQEITCYTDALYYTWKSLPQLTPKCQPKEIFINNLLELIDKIALPSSSINDNNDDRYSNNSSNSSSSSSCNEMCGPQNECGGFIWDLASAKRSLNKVWSCIMHWELSGQLHEKSLLVLLQRVMQHLEKPVLLNNYLMDSLDYEGPIGLLALRAIYLLVTKHNLEYPIIFKKLYSMFEPEIFHTKQKARLFYLSDIFTSSTHLPESLVAAFTKRLSRLTLVASPDDTLIILLFINNLLLRYPGLKRLIDADVGLIVPNNNNLGIGDVFLMEECDPLLSNAMFSSLWEIRLLENHVLPNIASAAKLIRDPVSSVVIVEYDMSAVLLNKNDQQKVFDMEIKKITKDIMLTFQRPIITMEESFNNDDERHLQYWPFTLH